MFKAQFHSLIDGQQLNGMAVKLWWISHKLKLSTRFSFAHKKLFSVDPSQRSSGYWKNPSDSEWNFCVTLIACQQVYCPARSTFSKAFPRGKTRARINAIELRRNWKRSCIVARLNINSAVDDSGRESSRSKLEGVDRVDWREWKCFFFSLVFRTPNAHNTKSWTSPWAPQPPRRRLRSIKAREKV